MRRHFSIALLALCALTWGHDGATLAAKALAPRPETFRQLFDRPCECQAFRAVAEPYTVGTIPKVVAE